MSGPLARRPESQPTVTVGQDPFDLAAMNRMAQKIEKLKEFMDVNLEKGIDWEVSHVLFKRQLKPGEEQRNMLLDPGTAKIMNFMQVRPRHVIQKEVDVKAMQITYTVRTEIIPWIPVMYSNPVTGQMDQVFPVIAEGVGSATTREKQYKVRFEWMKEKNLKTEGWTDEDLAKYAEEHPDGYKPPRDKYDALYYMPTAENLGLDNNLLKISSKRSEMDAVFQLPGVAGRYSQEIDLDPDRGEEKPKAPEEKPAQPEAKPPTPVAKPPEAPKPQPEKAQEPDAAKVAEFGFRSAAEIPKVPDDFRLEGTAAYVADFIAENFDQHPETVRALIYKETRVNPSLSAEAAAKMVQQGFEDRSKPVEEPEAEPDSEDIDAILERVEWKASDKIPGAASCFSDRNSGLKAALEALGGRYSDGVFNYSIGKDPRYINRYAVKKRGGD